MTQHSRNPAAGAARASVSADVDFVPSAFISSACTLVIELIAGRIMAPYIGVSLYTWTSIIGVVLAGMSGGNFVGGVVADRYASRRRSA